MCYGEAVNVEHYCQLIREGFRKIRAANDSRLRTAPNAVLASSAGQHVNSGKPNAQVSEETRAPGVRRTPFTVNEAVKTTANHMSHPPKQFMSINVSNPTHPANSAVPANSTNSVVYHNNVLGTLRKPITQKINHILSSKENYLGNPAEPRSQPSALGNARLSQFAKPTLNQTTYTPAASPIITPIHSIPSSAGRNVVASTVTPLPNGLSNHIPRNFLPNQSTNLDFNAGVNRFTNQMNGRASDQLFSSMDNPPQATSPNPPLLASQPGLTSASRTDALPPNDLTTTMQTPGLPTQKNQPYSSGVSQVLAMGTNPESLLSGVPAGNANGQRVPKGSSNQVKPIAQTPIQPIRQLLDASDKATDKKHASKTNRVAVSGAENSFSQARTVTRGHPGGKLSYAIKSVSKSSAGSKRARPREKAIQGSVSKKRNRFTTCNDQLGSSSVAAKRVSNSVLAGSAAPTCQQDPFRGIAHSQRKPHNPSLQLPNLEAPLSPSDPSLNERMVVSDNFHVSLAQIYTAATSCGYKLTAEEIKSLPKEQVLRFLIDARQVVLKNACNLPLGENGQINISKQQLHTLDTECRTAETATEQGGSGKATFSSIPNSSPQIEHRDSLPVNMEMKKTDMMPRNRNFHSTAYETNACSQNKIQIASRNATQERPKRQDSRGTGGPHLTTRKTSSGIGPTNSLQGSGQIRAVQGKKLGFQAPVASSKGMRANAAQGAETTPDRSQKLPVATTAGVDNLVTSLGAQLSRPASTDNQTLRKYTATLCSRVTQFQQKYAIYKNLINQTLQLLLSKGYEGRKQVLYLQYSMKLLTQSAALEPRLTLDDLNTTENFLRVFLVRYLGNPMKAEAKKNEQAGALTAGKPFTTNSEAKDKSKVQIGSINQGQIAVNVDSTGKDAENLENARSKTDRQAIREAATHESDSAFKPEDAKAHEKETSASPLAQIISTPNTVSSGGIQTLTPTTAMIGHVNQYSAIAQKVSRVNHYVIAALHEAEKCEKYLEQESMLRLKHERISEICYLFQQDKKKKARKSKGTEIAEGASESSLLEIIKEECDIAYKKHKKLMINIVQKWNKPVVECLLAYHCIRLPKIVIHVGGSYRKDLYTSVSFERPPFGWVSVLAEIKKRFTALMGKREGVSGVLQAWATAAEEVLGDEDI